MRSVGMLNFLIFDEATLAFDASVAPWLEKSRHIFQVGTPAAGLRRDESGATMVRSVRVTNATL